MSLTNESGLEFNMFIMLDRLTQRGIYQLLYSQNYSLDSLINKKDEMDSKREKHKKIYYIPLIKSC